MGQYTGVTDTAQAFMQTKLREILNDNGLTVTGSFKVTLSNGKEYFYNAKAGQMANSEVDLYPAATPGTPTTENSKYTSNNKTAVIPAGYTVDATQNSIDNGLVISKDGNEWVWIPVANVTDLYDTNTSNEEWILCGTSGDNKVVSQYASKARTDIRSDLTRGNPGTTAYREPDTLGDLPIYLGGGATDQAEANYTAAGFSSFNDMATKLRDDYKNMLDSVRKYGGFYVGRYELSEAGTKKDQPSLVSTTWYNLYAKCKTFGDESTTYSRMIWGCQWDQVCKFINTSGDKVSLTDSRTYGNYSNSQAPANTENYESGKKKNTGSNEAWKANNIYDLAGNCQEWTQEASYAYSRASRGGGYNHYGNGRPVAYRDGGDYGPTNTNDDFLSSRPVLYIK